MLAFKYEELGGEMKRLADLVIEAKHLHAQEQNLVLQSIRLLVELDKLNAAVNYRMHHDGFARYLGLTLDQYYKRKRVGQMMRFFPEIVGMLERSETTLSNLVAIAPKLTQANKDILLSGIKGVTKRAAEGLASRITANGQMLDREETFQLTLTLTKSQIAQLDRAKEVLAAKGHNPSNEQVVLKAVDDLLTKRDPMQKAARAMSRAEQKAKLESTGSGAVADQASITLVTEINSHDMDQVISYPTGARTSRVAEFKESKLQLAGARTSRVAEFNKIKPQPPRPVIAAAVKHAVYLRDQGQCTFAYANGRRCPNKGMLEIDHKTMWCRGGDHSAGNLRLRCREHNQFTAKTELGLSKDDYAKAAWQIPENCRG